jgi:hypothetical protein
VSLLELHLPDVFESYAGEDEGLPPPSLRKIPTGPVRTPHHVLEAALVRAKAAADPEAAARKARREYDLKRRRDIRRSKA